MYTFRLLVLALSLGFVACIDPAMPREAPADMERRLVVFAILDADRPSSGGHVALVSTTDVRETALVGVRASLRHPDGAVTTAVVDETSASCGIESVAAGPILCLVFPTSVVATAEYMIEVEADDDSYDEGVGPWRLDVYALDRALFAYLTSGTPGDLFSVAPQSNVEGGFGVVGAWARQSAPLGG